MRTLFSIKPLLDFTPLSSCNSHNERPKERKKEVCNKPAYGAYKKEKQKSIRLLLLGLGEVGWEVASKN